MDAGQGGFVSRLLLYVNGRRIAIDNPDPSTTLLKFLRLQLRLTGTKLGCGEGGCGACTVMVSKFDLASQKIKHFSVNACLAPLCSLHGMAVTTVEGIGSTDTKLHPVQERIAKAHGSQCGFCTPGIVMSMYTLLRNNALIEEEDFETAFQGNLCRCTGYRPILEGYKTFISTECCKGKAGGDCCMKAASNEESPGSDGYKLFDVTEFAPYDPTQEPIFPSELQTNKDFAAESLKFIGKHVTWYRPTSLTELLRLKHEHKDAKLLVGNTEIGVEVKFKHANYPSIICATHVPEIQIFSEGHHEIECGSAVSLADLDERLKGLIAAGKDINTDNFKALREMLHWFAGPQIRNVAAIGGNIMTASPISDLIPVLVAQGARLKLQAFGREARTVVMDQSFFLGYRRLATEADEVLISVYIPRNKPGEFVRAYKQAHRREDDISVVNAGMLVQFQPSSSRVKRLTLCFGGMAPTCVVAKTASSEFMGREWNDALLSDVLVALEKDLPLPHGVPGGSESYRRSLALSFFFRFFVDVSRELARALPDFKAGYDDSAIGLIESGHSEVGQLFEVAPDDQPANDPIGRPIPHMSAFKQATGEAAYLDDMPRFENELYMGLVFSQRAHANLVSVDPSGALAMDGVVAFVDNEDALGSKDYQLGISRECVFADGKVMYHGQPIAAVLARSQEEAQAAARAVEVTYEDLTPVVTIDDAIAANTTAPAASRVESGDVDAAFAKCDVVVEGEVRTGAQEHFYLETNACLAVPREDNELCVYCSTQHPTSSQNAIAEVLGIPRNRVEVKVKRLGGGFGGKESRAVPLSVWTAVAARKIRRPVRIMLDRDEDMATSGTRHPSLIKYKVGATSDGKILAVDQEVYLNAGFSDDLSVGVLGRALFTSHASYNIPNQRTKGFLCFTNLPSNTAFRGFGVPQSYFAVETWITHIASKLGLPAEEVRVKNFLKTGDPLPVIGQSIPAVTLSECWKKCMEISNFEAAKKECQLYNKQNRWKKRGVAAMTVAYPCSYPVRFLNQSGALVHIYGDGSVLLSHGGIEMGQGLNSKCAQVASRVLGIPVEKIYIAEAATDKVPNTSATAASFGTDLNANAVVDACRKLRDRLDPFIAADPKGLWEEWISRAYQEGVSLSATGFFFEESIKTFTDDSGRLGGKFFSYFTFGAGFSEVEIDCLTGDHMVRKVHLVMDIGASLNPAIDIGQIEGAYMQGYGFLTIEETRTSPGGFLFTRGPGAYKIPAFGNCPATFTVHILQGQRNLAPRAVYSSKAVGEPPLLLSLSTFCAIREAIAAARSEEGLEEFFRLDAPASCERIRMACADSITARFPEPPKGSYKPWDVQL